MRRAAAWPSWLLRHRELFAWVMVFIVCAASLVTVAQGYQAKDQLKSTSAQERKLSMKLSDMLETRLYQQVNAEATVHPPFAGAGATASVNGNDAVGQVNIETGSNPKAGSLVHVTFHTPYSTTETQPIVTLTPLDQSPPPDWYVTVDWYGFDIVVGSAPKPNTNYPFAYFVAPRPWAMYLGSK